MTDDRVYITNREIYDLALEVRADVVDLKILARVNAEERAEIKRRVRSLELKVYTVLAGIVTASGVLGASIVGRL